MKMENLKYSQIKLRVKKSSINLISLIITDDVNTNLLSYNNIYNRTNIINSHFAVISNNW